MWKGRVTVFAAEFVLSSTCCSSSTRQARIKFLFASHPSVSSFSSAIEYSALTRTLFPQVMHDYFVFLLQIVQAEGNFFPPRRHNSRKKTCEVGKAREKWVWRHSCSRMRYGQNEPRGLPRTGSLFNVCVFTIDASVARRLNWRRAIAIVYVLVRRVQRLGRI